jgi:hypothetical protein
MKNKCYVDVSGGIGNQLFKVANGYAYSQRYNLELVIDPTNWTASQGTSPILYQSNIFKNFNIIPRGETTEIHEISFNFMELPKYDWSYGDISLHGGFQSLKYFEDYKDEFISLLCLPKVDTSFISSDANIAFHIRFGDYQHYPKIFGDITNYFHKQFEKFSPDFQINVFSDSPELVLNKFRNYKFNLIKTSSELNDLTLLSLHDRIVCSNSTFSWWASLLGAKKELIIVPDKWLLDRDCKDIYYEGMIKNEF